MRSATVGATATTGRPEARASIATIPNDLLGLGWTNRQARLMAAAISSLEWWPSNDTRSAYAEFVRERPEGLVVDLGRPADHPEADRRSPCRQDRDRAEQRLDAFACAPRSDPEQLIGVAADVAPRAERLGVDEVGHDVDRPRFGSDQGCSLVRQATTRQPPPSVADRTASGRRPWPVRRRDASRDRRRARSR